MRFADETATVHTEVLAYDFIDFISDLGGALGLTLGFSFYALFDILKGFISMDLKVKQCMLSI